MDKIIKHYLSEIDKKLHKQVDDLWERVCVTDRRRGKELITETFRQKDHEGDCTLKKGNVDRDNQKRLF